MYVYINKKKMTEIAKNWATAFKISIILNFPPKVNCFHFANVYFATCNAERILAKLGREL